MPARPPRPGPRRPGASRAKRRSDGPKRAAASDPTTAAARAALEAQLDGLGSRGKVKAFARTVDEDPVLRSDLEALAAAKGLADASAWPAKRLVRALLDRDQDAQVRGNPIRRDPPFVCGFCGRFVPEGGKRVRDHCPSCLRSLHVDVIPGDRAADCGGILAPISFTLEGRAGVVIHHRCETCGAERRVRAHPDDQLPVGLDVALLPGAGTCVGLGAGAEGMDEALLQRARTLPARVGEAVHRLGLWQPGERVVLAVSGGLDSTVMMEVMAELGGLGAQLEVASIDHGLRPESVAEVAQVGRRARELGLPFHALELQLASGPNLQARAREARRGVLLALGADRIATAHHEDDQAETVLQHLLRGGGMSGLRGMRAHAGAWVRPLLREPRAVLQAWAELRGLRWFEDPTNEGSQRGRLRDLMPSLDGIHGGASGALARSARLLAREDALVAELADGAWSRVCRDGGSAVDRSEWVALHPALKMRVLRRLVSPVGPLVRADQLEALLLGTLQTGAVFTLPGGWGLAVADDRLVLVAREPGDLPGP